MQVICTLSFLQTGLGGENSTGVEPQAVSEGGKKRTHSEPNEQQSNKSKQKRQNLPFFLPFGGQQSEFFDRLYSKSFFRIVLPTVARSTILKTCGAKNELEHKNHERGILKLTFLMQIRIKGWSA